MEEFLNWIQQSSIMVESQITGREIEFIGYIALFFYVAAMLSVMHVLLHGRTAESTIAWVVSLITFPFIAVILYAVFGRRKFHGYVMSRRLGDTKIQHLAQNLCQYMDQFPPTFDKKEARIRAIEQIAQMPFTYPNQADLLIDGNETFEAIFNAIERAEDYILVQFFIFKDDHLGRKFRDCLLERAKAGIRIYLLYDEIGCRALPNNYFKKLKNGGIQVHSFNTTQGRRNRFQLNFRNHRKIIITDGREAFVGGMNIGDEYLGRNKHFGPWRDTHCRVKGPSVQCVQLAFIEDWHWTTQSYPDLNWIPEEVTGNANILILPTGPADQMETCNLFFVHTINSARKRIWIASPYFVPSPEVMSALRLAVLRGVDVRIMIPQKPDHLLVYLSAFSFIKEVQNINVRFFRYQRGFMHQKVMLMDNYVASVGTANMDNRSFRLNFEISVIVVEDQFAVKVKEMFINDFKNCREVGPEEYDSKSFFFKLWVRVARLLAPIQ